MPGTRPFWYLNDLHVRSTRRHPMPTNASVHLLDQGIDVLIPVAKITALDEVLEFPRPEASRRVGELEGPQEVTGLLEVRPDSIYFVDQVLHAQDTQFAEVLLDYGVVGQRDALLVAVGVVNMHSHIMRAHVISYILP